MEVTSDGFLKLRQSTETPHLTLYSQSSDCVLRQQQGNIGNQRLDSLRLGCRKCGMRVIIDRGLAEEIGDSLPGKGTLPDGTCLPGLSLELQLSLLQIETGTGQLSNVLPSPDTADDT